MSDPVRTIGGRHVLDHHVMHKSLSPAERAELFAYLRRNFADGTAILVDGKIQELSAEEYLERLERTGLARWRLRFHRRAIERTRFYPRGVMIRLNDIDVDAPVFPSRMQRARPRERRGRIARTSRSSAAGGDDPPPEEDPEPVGRARPRGRVCSHGPAPRHAASGGGAA